MAVEADELIGRLRVQFGIGRNGSAQGREILKAELLRDDQHLGFVALHLVEPQLVDGCRREIGGGALADEEGVVLVSVGEGPKTGIGPACRDVRRREKASELRVGGQDLLLDRFENRGLDAGLVFGRDACREFLQGTREGRVFRLLLCDGVDLNEDLFEKIFRRDAVIFDAGHHVGADLLEDGGDFRETRGVVVVIFDGFKGEERNQLGQLDVRAPHLRDGHLPRLEFGFLLLLDELAHHQIVAEDLLIGQAGGIDGGESNDVVAAASKLVVVGGDRVVGELVVVALVADGGGKLRGVAELLLPHLGEERLERGAAVFEGDGDSC